MTFSLIEILRTFLFFVIFYDFDDSKNPTSWKNVENSLIVEIWLGQIFNIKKLMC